MDKCKECDNEMILMTGTVYLTPDAEPYESGVEEESKIGLANVEKHISAAYCEKCDKVKDINEE